jgi:hypothetical protein
MRAAGYRGPDVFASDAVAMIARAANGLSRRINVLADKALLSAFSQGTHAVAARQARAAIADSEFAPPWRARRPIAAYAAIGAAGLALGIGAAWLLQSRREGAPAAASVPAAPAELKPAPTAAAPPAPPAAAAPVAPAAAAATAAPAPAVPPPPLLQREKLARLAGYNDGRFPLLRARLEAARERIATEPDERYSIELYITDNSDPARVERFLMRARDLVPIDEVFVLPVPDGNRYRIWALYGVFADRGAAQQAAGRLPPKYQQAFQTQPRSFAELRRAL